MVRMLITLSGCDDVTQFTFDVDNDPVSTLQDVANESENVSTYQCEPYMRVEVVASDYTIEDDD